MQKSFILWKTERIPLISVFYQFNCRPGAAFHLPSCIIPMGLIMALAARKEAGALTAVGAISVQSINGCCKSRLLTNVLQKMKWESIYVKVGAARIQAERLTQEIRFIVFPNKKSPGYAGGF